MTEIVNIEYVRGDNADFEIEITDEDTGAVVNLTGASVWMSVKTNKKDTSYLIQKMNTLAGGGDDEIEMTDPTNGICQAKFVPADTASVRASKYIYDVQVVLSNGKKYTPISGQFTLVGDVTRD